MSERNATTWACVTAACQLGVGIASLPVPPSCEMTCHASGGTLISGITWPYHFVRMRANRSEARNSCGGDGERCGRSEMATSWFMCLDISFGTSVDFAKSI